MTDYDLCPAIAPVFGFIGVASAVVFSNIGAAYGTAKAGIGIMISGISSPDLIWKNLIPIIMAGVNGIYGLITAIILESSITSPSDDETYTYSLYTGCAHLAAGLCTGLTGLASGLAIGLAGEAGVRGSGAYDAETKRQSLRRGGGFVFGTGGKGRYGGGKKQSKKKKKGNVGADQLFVSMVLIQVFAGNLALYGLITSIILSTSTYTCGD